MTAGDERLSASLLLRPLTGLAVDDAADGYCLGGGPLIFTHVEILDRSGANRGIHAVEDLPVEMQPALNRLTTPRSPLADLDWARPRIMGVVNVTPDSFSDGGDTVDPGAAIARGLALLDAGADVLDVGGESTRPGAAPVAPKDEQRRIVPVIRALAGQGAVVSVDTRHAGTMRAALDAGAHILNDVTALRGDPESLDVAADADVPVIVMHMLGEPQTMQDAPAYENALLDIFAFFEERIAACEAAGLPADRLVLDPGIGFGKTLDHNREVLRRVGLYHGLGCPLAIGVSRKRFIAALSRGEPPRARVPGSLAACLAAVDQGVQLVRVHDVAETAQALAIWSAIRIPDESRQ